MFLIVERDESIKMNKFWAKNKLTKEYWNADPAYRNQILAQDSNGQLIVLTDMHRENWSISYLENYEITTIEPTETIKEVEKIECPTCRGSGKVMEIVDHDADCNSVWDHRQCWRCHGTGKIIKK